MTVKLANISDWARMSDDRLVVLSGPAEKSRKVRFEVNVGLPTRFDLMRKGEDAFHLLTADSGHHVVEFYVKGEVGISAMSTVEDAEGNPVPVEAWFYTADLQHVHAEPSDRPTLTKLANRPPRNYAAELIAYQAERRLRRRMAAVEEQAVRQLTDRISTQLADKAGEKDGKVKGAKAADGGARGAKGGGRRQAAEGEAEGEGGGNDAPASGGGKLAGDGSGERPKGARGSAVPSEA